VVSVALVTSSFLPRTGGVEEHVRNVASRLRDRGHRVVVWAVDQGDEGAPAVVDGVPVRYLPTPLPARSAGAALAFAAALPEALRSWRAAVRADRPDVLHVHCYGPNGLWAHALSAMTRTPLVLSGHGETFGDAHDAFGTSALLRAGLRRTLRTARAVTACSAYALEDLERRFGLRAGRGVVVPNGIELSEPAGARPDWLPARYLIAVGRAVRTKGFDLLVDAFARADLPADLHLVIGGDGPELDPLRAQVRAAGLGDRVLLPGRLSRPEVVTAVAGARALVVPSRVEAFGIVVLEGWRAGVPVVATSAGGPPEFVADGRTGLLVDPRDVAALARALERVTHDDELAARLGAAGSAAVVSYSWERTVAAYEAVYQDVLARRSAGEPGAQQRVPQAGR
jgi:glycogen(starch) synthase